MPLNRGEIIKCRVNQDSYRGWEGKEGCLEFLPQTVSSGFRLHQTVLPISRIGPTILFGNARQHEQFRIVTYAHTGGFCAHGSLHLYVSLRRAPPSRHFVKTTFSSFRFVLIRLSGTPETSKLLSFSIVFLFVSRFRQRNPFRRNHHQLRHIVRKIYLFPVIY